MVSILEEVKNARSIGITGHVRPDGDCAGSTLGLYNYLKNALPDIQTDIYLEPFEHVFDFLNGSDLVQHERQNNVEYDVFFVLDCGDPERVAEFVRPAVLSAGKTVCIDHHVSNTGFATVNHVLPKISSTCEVLFELMDDAFITKEVAECLYVGIIHDTGVLKYQSTSSRTMAIAGILMGKGIDFTSIIDDTFFRKTHIQNVVTGLALYQSRLVSDGLIVYSFLGKEVLNQYGLTGKDLGGIIDQLRFTQGVEVAVFLYELEDGLIKGSLRSVKKIDVNAIASQFKGGGHIRAAGFSSNLLPEDILKIIESQVAAQLS